MRTRRDYLGKKAKETVESDEDLSRLEHDCEVALSIGDNIIGASLLEGIYQAYVSRSSSEQDAQGKFNEYLSRVINRARMEAEDAQRFNELVGFMLEHLELKFSVTLTERKAEIGRDNREDKLEKLGREIAKKRRK